ncbi:hypothetical protein [Undibacterium fentianense]|uniref:Uncharacterized protein n=1 Tax=Undibacterium fentianense TaxID=2828728 RepID=A0A941E6I1_9BURK|nr:hypothetical protein [Undibacterium fentianense]MBR7800668.1 hypothetical protein [Undibacterium fentianense]
MDSAHINRETILQALLDCDGSCRDFNFSERISRQACINIIDWKPMSHGLKLTIILFTFLLVTQSAFAIGDDCPLDQPKAILENKAPNVKTYRVKTIGAHEIQEVFTLTSGETFHVKSWGCEYVVLTIRFESRNLPYQKLSLNTMAQSASIALRKLATLHPNTIFNLNAAANALERAIKQRLLREVDEPITIDTKSELSPTVTLVKSRKLGEITSIELELALGPM